MYASDSSASDGIIMQRRARQLQCSTYIGLENIKNRIKFFKYVYEDHCRTPLIVKRFDENKKIDVKLENNTVVLCSRIL